MICVYFWLRLIEKAYSMFQFWFHQKWSGGPDETSPYTGKKPLDVCVMQFYMHMCYMQYYTGKLPFLVRNMSYKFRFN